MISSEQAWISYTLTTSGQVLPIPFVYLLSADIGVIQTRAGVDTTLILNTDYTLAGGGIIPATGNLTMVAGTAGDIISIFRSVPETQTTGLTTNGPFPAKTIETTYDRLVMISQRIQLETSRSLRLPKTNGAIAELALSARISKILGFDAAGNPAYYSSATAVTSPILTAMLNLQVPASVFAFTPLPLLGALSAGVPATVTLSPVPFGVNGTNVGHYLRISGDANSEAVLITGGTATSGAASGTITFTPAFSHASGAWSLGSATSGLQEALYYLSAGGTVLLPAGVTLLYARVTIPPTGSPYIIAGAGTAGTYVKRDSSYAAGDLFVADGSVGSVRCNYRDFTIQNAEGFNNTSGYAFNFNAITNSFAAVDRVWIYNGQNGIKISASANIWLTNVYYLQSSAQVAGGWGATAGLYITGLSGAIYVTNCIFGTQATTTTAALTYGILIENCDGVNVTSTSIKAQRGVNFAPSGAMQITNIYFTQCILDECLVQAVTVAGATTGVFQNVRFTGCHMVGYNRVSETDGIGLANTKLRVFQLIGCNISGWRGNGVAIGAGQFLSVEDCLISDCDAADLGAWGILISAGTNIKVNGGIIGCINQGTPLMNGGISVNGTADFIDITDVMVVNTQGEAITVTTIPTHLDISGCFPQRSTVPSLASAATVTLNPYDTYKITGTTNITIINGGWIGRRVTFIVIGGFTFNTGGNIAAAVVKAANTRAEGVFDGTNWYIQ